MAGYISNTCWLAIAASVARSLHPVSRHGGVFVRTRSLSPVVMAGIWGFSSSNC